MENCKCCNSSVNVLDGLCDDCEDIWMKELDIMATIAPHGTTVYVLFIAATIRAKVIIALHRGKKRLMYKQ
jgi:hypothetical protein